MSASVVTVICLCYNHRNYVREAIESVLNQSHSQAQIIIVDNGSTDGSKEVIERFHQEHPEILFIDLSDTIGYCAALNLALTHATGEYIIDLSTDDILLPTRIETGLRALQKNNQSVAVHFGDAEMIDASGKHLSLHSDRFPHNSIPQGNVYKDLIERYFICSPSMMYHTSIIKKMNGYDETLAYEDFDFWIRSSREFPYLYSSEVLVKKRLLKNSMSAKQFRIASRYQRSTYKICKKILELNACTEEQRALSNRILYEIRVNLRLLNFLLAGKYVILWLRNKRMAYSV